MKLPFPVTGGRGRRRPGLIRWMWVSVTDADAETVTGTLANTPVYVADLRNGSSVTGLRSDVADYVLDLGHGVKEGGESIQALQKAASP